jgi:hypothetical protein
MNWFDPIHRETLLSRHCCSLARVARRLLGRPKYLQYLYRRKESACQHARSRPACSACQRSQYLSYSEWPWQRSQWRPHAARAAIKSSWSESSWDSDCHVVVVRVGAGPWPWPPHGPWLLPTWSSVIEQWAASVRSLRDCPAVVGLLSRATLPVRLPTSRVCQAESEHHWLLSPTNSPSPTRWPQLAWDTDRGWSQVPLARQQWCLFGFRPNSSTLLVGVIPGRPYAIDGPRDEETQHQTVNQRHRRGRSQSKSPRRPSENSLRWSNSNVVGAK